MKAEKYAQLFGTATAITTNITYHLAQLNAFSVIVVNISGEICKKLEAIQINLRCFDDVTPPLSKTQQDILHTQQRELAQLSKQLKQDIEDPEKKLRKAIDKIAEDHTSLAETVAKHLGKCEFDLSKITAILDPVKPQLAESKKKFNTCDQELVKCQAKIATIENMVHRLDLPSDIQHATKQVEKITKELASLQLQFTSQPKILFQYQRELTPLQDALNILKQQTNMLTNEENKTAAAPSMKP